MKNLNGEQIAGYSLLLAVIALFIGLLIHWASPKHVHSYTLGSSGPSGGLHIRVDIENSEDDFIPLIGVDYQEAVQLVDSLNKTLTNARTNK